MPGVQEAAELQAMINEAGFGDPRDATIARLTEELAEARGAQIEGWPAASVLNRWLREYRDERDSALADLAALGARVEAAVARCQRTISAWNTNHDAVSDFRCEEASDLLTILSPPEADHQGGADG